MAKVPQNINAIRQLLAGEHKIQTRKTFTVPGEQTNDKHEVGDTWAEYNTDGSVKCYWTQKNGYRMKSGRDPETQKVFDELRESIKTQNTYFNCEPDCHTLYGNKNDPDHKSFKFNGYSKLDEKFLRKFNKCADCQFRFETKMKLNGTFAQYERDRMLNEAESFFKDADIEFKKVITELANNDGINFVNRHGEVEKWESDHIDTAQMQSEYNQYKEIALNRIREYGEHI